MRAKAALVTMIGALALAAPAHAAVIGWGFNGKGELGGGFKGMPHLPIEAPPSVAGAVQVVSTYFTSYALMPDGTVWAWGGNDYGQLGDGDRTNQLVPVQVHGLTGVRQIAAGAATAIALLSDGRVATWGGNAWGTLGNGTTGAGSGDVRFSSTLPVFPAIRGATAVAAGGADDAAILSDGTVLAWGENSSGQLGDGTTVAKDVPTPVSGLGSVRAVALGGGASRGAHMLALLADGTVRATGSNAHGELGLGTTTAVDAPVKVPGLQGVVAVSASLDHSMALLSSGAVMAWGGDTFGQLGVKATARCHRGSACVPYPIRTGVSGSAIAAGRLFSLVVSGGQVLAFGYNAQLQLGLEGPSRTKAVAVPGLSGVTAVSASELHSLALGTLR
jgi:alpha-tubulin suppressor-like RCC1 family protein